MHVCFFFKAEDGIRDADVPGVQTCALPLSCGAVSHPPAGLKTLAAGTIPLPTLGSLRPRPTPPRPGIFTPPSGRGRSEEHTSELQSRPPLVCRLLLAKKKKEQPTWYDVRVK